ncbi:MAG TPA: DUF2059 domain-containing protein [Candidatus Acidoferrum sp.]|nr:DUF2059 domain-containing protein [Candidatus Acidoferrum sp.]
MKTCLTLMAVLLFALSSARAQTSPSGTQQTPLHRAPGTATPSSPAASPPASSQASPNTTEPAPVAVSPQEDKSIRQLMELMGSNRIPENLDQSLNYQLRSAMTARGMPDDRLKLFLQDFNQDFAAQSPDAKVTTAMVQVFASHLSAADIAALVQFYQSPLGMRFMDALPQIIESSQQAGAKIVRDEAISVLRQMADQYPEVKQLLPPDNSSPAGSQSPSESTPPPPHLDAAPSSNPSPQKP